MLEKEKNEEEIHIHENDAFIQPPLKEKEGEEKVKRRIVDFERRHEDKGGESPWGAWFSLGWRIALEWGAAVLIGYGVGTVVDRFCGIQPFGVVIFLLLGNIAGLLNIYRILKSEIRTF